MLVSVGRAFGESPDHLLHFVYGTHTSFSEMDNMEWLVIIVKGEIVREFIL